MSAMSEADDTKTDPAPAPAPAAAQPDLDGLQRLIDAEKAKGSSEATSALLSTLGFDTLDALQSYVTDRKAADEAAMSEVERREAAAAAAEAAAQARAAEAAQLIRTGVVNLALVRAGVDPANVALAAPLVTLGDDLTDAAADAAVASLKTNPALASLFGAVAKPAPSGVTAPAPAGAGGSTVTALERGAELYAKRHPAKSA
jgi:hypothetical protein